MIFRFSFSISCSVLNYFIKFQQAHQKNQVKDSIDVDEPEGTHYLTD